MTKICLSQIESFAFKNSSYAGPSVSEVECQSHQLGTMQGLGILLSVLPFKGRVA